uniref:transforming acidic coiled-coil-containing protein 1 isoform X2 n=1 Tax=Myxine glutinosa TaxID=7769 RepID=UPI003590139F
MDYGQMDVPDSGGWFSPSSWARWTWSTGLQLVHRVSGGRESHPRELKTCEESDLDLTHDLVRRHVEQNLGSSYGEESCGAESDDEQEDEQDENSVPLTLSTVAQVSLDFAPDGSGSKPPEDNEAVGTDSCLKSGVQLDTTQLELDDVSENCGSHQSIQFQKVSEQKEGSDTSNNDMEENRMGRIGVDVTRLKVKLPSKSLSKTRPHGNAGSSEQIRAAPDGSNSEAGSSEGGREHGDEVVTCKKKRPVVKSATFRIKKLTQKYSESTPEMQDPETLCSSEEHNRSDEEKLQASTAVVVASAEFGNASTCPNLDQTISTKSQVPLHKLEIDYLEQFGSSKVLTNSELRKQSLYLRFDPLLANTTVNSDAAGRDGAETPETVPPTANPANPLDLLSSEVLERSTCEAQATKDLQASTAQWRMRAEEAEENLLTLKNLVQQYEGVMMKTVEQQQKQKVEMDAALAKFNFEKSMISDEKKQALSDLANVERSFSELYKRYDKLKEAVDGYEKNEKTLKNYAEELLTRFKKEEQRYKALKAHAEEKLARASQDLAVLKEQGRLEILSLQAALQKEQVKFRSMEHSLQQKDKALEELTRICDELIGKMKPN